MDILVADDHALVREGLRPFLQTLSDGVAIAEVETFDDVRSAMAGTRRFDLIFLDLGLPGMRMIDDIKTVIDGCAPTPVIILSGRSDPMTIHATIKMGAAGFVPKSASSSVLLNAVKLVLSGERYIPSQVFAQQDIATPRLSETDGGDGATRVGSRIIGRSLSKRELDVLEQIVHGMTNKEIARLYGLQETTIKIHVKNIYRKMGVANRAQAVRTAIEANLGSAV